MANTKIYKIYDNNFSLMELEDINKFVIKKLNAADIYKVRDRFEGNQFQINTIKKVLMLKTLLKFLKIVNYQKIKIGFLNTVNIESFISCKIIYPEFENDVNNINFQPNTIYCIVNSKTRKCTIYSKDTNFERVKESILQSLEKHNSAIFDN